jgi:hypothetical protein
MPTLTAIVSWTLPSELPHRLDTGPVKRTADLIRHQQDDFLGRSIICFICCMSTEPTKVPPTLIPKNCAQDGISIFQLRSHFIGHFSNGHPMLIDEQ